MAGAIQAGYYVWEVHGQPVVVHLHLDVVDRILAEVMRGFGAVPKRGAEVGGILIGFVEHRAAEHGDVSVVRIDDFEPVECGYKRGPSYLFSGDDAAAFADAVRQWQPDATRSTYAVGFFRSHTRDGLSLSGEDIGMMDEYFPAPSHVALIIKPYGTKVSLAGFFIREDGSFPDTAPLEFPFRRRELAGEDAPPRRSMIERRPRPQRFAEIPPAEVEENVAADPMPLPSTGYAVTVPSKSRLRSSIWVPLSFVFLVFGVALGMMIALTRSPAASRGDGQDFSLGLVISKTDDNLSVKWDRQSAAIHTAQRGVLVIEDGSHTQSVDLDTAQLQNGSIIYRNSSPTVRFRLIVYPRARVSVTESAEWKQEAR
jgi:hypothetical protein